MSIIHIGGRSTDNAETFETNRASDRSMLLVDGGALVEDFSVELTVGSNWSRQYGPRTNAMYRIEAEGVPLPVGGSIVIEAAEELKVPYNMYGLVIPTGSLFLDRGVIIAAAKIEPSFSGKLKLRLVNASGERRTLKAGEKVASAIFFRTEVTRFQNVVTKTIADAAHAPSKPKMTLRWIKANRITVIGWAVAILCSSVSALLINYFLLSPHR